MVRKRTAAPLSGELFDRTAYSRGSKTLQGRARRGGLVARSAVVTSDDDEIESAASFGLDPAAGGHEAARAPPVVRQEEPVSHRAPVETERFDDPPHREFEYALGIHLTDSILWCDCERRSDLCFLSHAHADFVGKNRRILATEKTVRILTRATGKVEALTSPYRRPFTLGPLNLEMHPAGHVLGSAQLLIERQDRRLVYTSDVSTRASATAEKAKPVPCDVLVLPATYGLPIYRFPPREEVFGAIKRFVERCFEEHATPVLLAEQIGTSQELMRLLGEVGFKLRVHGSIYDVAKIYRELGISLPGARRFGGTPARDEVVIFPPILKKHAAIRKLKKFKTALVSGRAVEPGFAVQQRVDEAFPLADAADHDELLEFVRGTGAREIYLSGGHVEEFSAELRALDLKVFSLVPPKQLSLL